MSHLNLSLSKDLKAYDPSTNPNIADDPIRFDGGAIRMADIPVFTIGSLGLSIWDSYAYGVDFWDDLWDSLYLFHSTLTIPGIIIGFIGYCLRELWHKMINLRFVPTYELNRQTGMVIFYDKEGDIEQELPFKEFVAHIQPVTNHQGLVIHNNLIVHHYQDPSTYFDAHQLGAGESQLANPLAVWNFIQCYMDTTQPLPDLPQFEPFRHTDPFTKAWDIKHNRDPHYWRNMSKKEINQAYKRQHRINVEHAEAILQGSIE